MVSASSTQVGPDYLSVRDFVAEARSVLQSSLERRIREGITAGEVGQGTHPEEVAALFGTVLRGMAIQARDGVSSEGLTKIGQRAMSYWSTNRSELFELVLPWSRKSGLTLIRVPSSPISTMCCSHTVPRRQTILGSFRSPVFGVL